MKKISFFLFQILFVVFLHTGLSQTSKPPLWLSGKWAWQETQYIIRGMQDPVVINPSVIDTTMEVVFEQEHLHLYKNGTHSGTFTYHLLDYDENQKMIKIDYDHFQEPLKVDHGPLLISDNRLSIEAGYNDAGGTQFFERIE